MKDDAVAQLSDQVMALTARMQSLKESSNHISKIFKKNLFYCIANLMVTCIDLVS
jgi:primosomal protein N''